MRFDDLPPSDLDLHAALWAFEVIAKEIFAFFGHFSATWKGERGVHTYWYQRCDRCNCPIVVQSVPPGPSINAGFLICFDREPCVGWYTDPLPVHGIQQWTTTRLEGE